MEAGTGGDRWLGGDDLDRALQTHILKEISQDYNISDIDKLIEKLREKDIILTLNSETMLKILKMSSFYHRLPHLLWTALKMKMENGLISF